MTARPRYPKPDANQATLCRDLVALELGFEAYTAISKLTDKECPGDVLVYGWHCLLGCKVWQVFEIKTERGELTPSQFERRDKVPVARCMRDILAWYGYEANKGPPPASS